MDLGRPSRRKPIKKDAATQSILMGSVAGSLVAGVAIFAKLLPWTVGLAVIGLLGLNAFVAFARMKNDSKR